MANNQISQKKEKEKTNMCEFKFVPECPYLVIETTYCDANNFDNPCNKFHLISSRRKKTKTYCM